MTVLLWILVLALAWLAVNGTFDVRQFFTGVMLGSLVLLLAGVLPLAYLRRAWRLCQLLAIFAIDLVLANLRLARDVVMPRSRLSPGVVAIPLSTTNDLETTLLANLISLTPGSLTLDISDDRKTMYIHSMWADDPDALRRSVKDRFEHRIRELSR